MSPSARHEATIDLCRTHPPLVAELLQDILGIPIPEFKSTSIEAADFNQTQPREFRADAVIALRTTKPKLVVIVEMQLKTTCASDGLGRSTSLSRANA